MAPDLSSLYNSNPEVIGNPKEIYQKEKTLIVLGIARGGTSLVSGTLHHLGVFTGQASGHPIFEDVSLAFAIENNNSKQILNIISKYNKKHAIWSFKRPGIINHLSELHVLWRNPIYLIIFKDIFSIANRNKLSMKLPIIPRLIAAQEDYAKIIDFISNNSINGVLFSYEKIMNDKQAFIETLSKIAQQQDKIKKERALEFITPNPTDYLNISRTTRSTGTFHIHNANTIRGWCKYISHPQPVTVELYINDKLVDKKVADEMRQHLLSDNKHPTGKCGFSFNLISTHVKPGDKVQVKANEDICFLETITYNENE